MIPLCVLGKSPEIVLMLCERRGSRHVQRGFSFALISATAKTPVSVIMEASLKMVGTLRNIVRAPAVIAPKAEPMLNIVDR